jgi:protein-disulfide isomerase
MLSDKAKQGLMVVAVACAVILTGLRIAEFAMAEYPQRPTDSAPVAVANWSQYTQAGHRLGSAVAPVTIVEFGDFECPFCAEFARETLPEIQARFPGKIALVYRYFPLQFHHLAFPAARAAECAAQQGHFAAYHDELYAHQDSLGVLSFLALARLAGISDLGAFARCDSATGPVPAIDRDVAAARAVGAHATPTFLIDGRMYTGTIAPPTMDSIVGAILRRKGNSH